LRPSEHPQRRRIHHTCVVHGDGTDVSVVRYDDGRPLLMHDGVGVVLELLRACWSRRRENCGPGPEPRAGNHGLRE
jgi:hypothetical protein